jgi:hypothetical protein
MATSTVDLGVNLSIAEIVRREDPDGTLAQLIDVISQENHILDHIQWEEANNGDFHEVTRVVAEPAGQDRTYDLGVTKEAGITEKIVEPTQMMASLSEVDDRKFKRAANPDAFRLGEDGLFLKGMTKTFVSRLFDGSRGTNNLRINGINDSSRDYAALSSDYTYDQADGNASADANKTSVYFVQFGQGKVMLTYPRNNPAVGGTTPIKMEDFGKSIIDQSGTSGTLKYPAWQTWFSIDFGLAIYDPRCIKRIVNISTSNIDGVDDFAWSEDPMIDAYNDLEYNGEGAVIFCNRTVLAQAQKRANEKGNAFFTMQSEGEGPFARPVTRFMGIPMERVDQITNTQSTIS